MINTMGAIWLITGLIILTVDGSLFINEQQFVFLCGPSFELMPKFFDPTLDQECQQHALNVIIFFPFIIMGTGLAIYGAKLLPSKKGHQLFSGQKHQKVCGRCNYNLSKNELKSHHCNNCGAEW